MKRRAKIITTIASLCLAVALMAFGVYAATSTTLGISSRVKFEVVDVFVDVDGDVKVGHDSTFVAASPTGSATYDGQSYTGTPGTNAVATALDPASWAIGDVTLTSENYVVKYTITVKNVYTEAKTVNVKIDKLLAAITNTTTTAKYEVYTSTGSPTGTMADFAANDVINVAQNKTLIMVFTRTLNNRANDLAATACFDSATMTIAFGESTSAINYSA